MTAKEVITDEIPPLMHTDSGEKALIWMEEFKVSHLPVLKNRNFVGLVSENDILDKKDLELPLDVLFDHLPRPYVFEHAHIYEVLAKMAEHRISVLPVLDSNENYLGCTSVYQLMTLIANTTSIKEVGGIVVLEMNSADYSLAQIAQIVESENAKILSSFIMSSSYTTKLEVTLKISEVDLSRIIRSFERYDMTVKASFQRSTDQDDLQFRYDALMNYLNI
ncbi:CBS domain-containing protein [Fluviicola sp.]|jgi:CBS domain-containing protein|uniref:CBS domain-containing protein n=1 Tax=Fluviicola sp. TaxID=1917219 RepID=UPI00281E0EA5|nr:CBS domain-containing protein [Fluviicola sp.]MDR0803010.1 CBS domain-containing protein [Fluviicola sp.]